MIMSNTIPNRANWVLDASEELLINDKKRLIRKYFNEELIEVLSMFKYENLPKTLDARTLELFILGGYGNFFSKNNNVYNGVGSFSGVLDFRYIPEDVTLTNVYLNYSKTLKVINDYNIDDVNESNKENYVVVIPNDYMYNGIIDALKEYAEFQAESDLTLKMLLYHLRLPFVANTDDNNVKVAFDVMIGDIVEGRFPKSIIGNALYESLKTYPMDNATQGRIKEVIELKQYKKAQFENRLGLGTNYNMKRESLTDSEVDADSDTLLPTPDEMLECRKKGIEFINKAFGTKISVEFASAWKIRRELMKTEKELTDAMIENEKGGDEDVAKTENVERNDNNTTD